MFRLLKIYRIFKDVIPPQFSILKTVPAVFSVNRNHIATWNVFCRKIDDINITSNNKLTNEEVKISVDVLADRGLTEGKKSKAMLAYLERAQKYNAFMKQQTDEFNAGKRHLANMMGVDPATFIQKDVDAAIEYLFPSGLFVPAARPFMKPPEKVFPPKKDAEFDDSGRPFHFLFYTGKPNFYNLLHDFNVHLKNLNDFEDNMIRKQLAPDPNIKMELSGSVWVSKDDLETKLVEEISDKEYSSFLSLMERIISHPYVYTIKDAVVTVRKPLMDTKMDLTKPPKPSYDKSGRGYVKTTVCARKSARATVIVWYPGTGVIRINGEDINYFSDVQPREQILFPLHFSGMLNKVDVDAKVSGGGTSGQAGAIRWGIAWGLRSFVTADMIEKMRLAGLLTRDIRIRERKKPGQWKARRKYTWKKR